MSSTQAQTPTPIAIGCIGGSGSRLVCNILKRQDIYMGSELNPSEDNLWFSFLFKRNQVLDMNISEFKILLDIFISKLENSILSDSQIKIINEIYKGEHTLTKTEIDDGYNSLISNTQIESIKKLKKWGWKEPNTHLYASKIFDLLPNFKFIYLQRNSLDMAFSNNQNQPLLWGKYYLENSYDGTPRYSLKYWIKTHQRMKDLKSKMLDQMYIMDYESLCNEPQKEIKSLNKFLEIDTNTEKLKKLSELITPPNTIGRYKNHSLDVFDKEDLDYAKKLGHLD